MLDGIVWLATQMGDALRGAGHALSQPGLWLDWSDKQALMRFIYYGASRELFFVAFALFVVLTLVGLMRGSFMWAGVRGLEAVANGVGRFAAWAGLLMVLQQIVIVFCQRIFASAQLGFGIGTTVELDLSWWAEELKLYNAVIVSLCCAYTFVQKGHVRVDLLYAPASFRTKRVIDMLGALLFMLPMATLMWLYAWFFMWRHLVTPKVSASDSIELLLRKARVLRWNVETIGFSPNGFSGYFLFKVLLVLFTAMIFLQAVATFWRAICEFREGPASEDRYLDRDATPDPEPAEAL